MVNYINKIVSCKITAKSLHIRKNEKIKKAHPLRYAPSILPKYIGAFLERIINVYQGGDSMSIKILEKYLQVCRQYGLEPNWKDLKKFKDIC